MASSTPRNSAATSAANTSGEPDVGDDRRCAAWCPVSTVDVALSAQGCEPQARGPRRRAPATIGAWTKKIARHANSWVSMPPSAGPIAAPTAPASAHHRRARLEPSAATGTMAPSTGNDPASSSVAPTPCTARATRSIGRGCWRTRPPARRRRTSRSRRRAGPAGGTGGAAGRPGTDDHGDDEGVRRQHPRHADDRRVELGVQVGAGPGRPPRRRRTPGPLHR